MYKLAIIALCLALAGLQYRLWVAEGGYAEIARLSEKIEKITANNAQMQARNGAMAAEIKDLKSGVAAMEGRARVNLGMVKTDEQFYLIVEPN